MVQARGDFSGRLPGVRAAHEAGLEVVVWTANRPRDWKRLLAAEVDAIITDNPEALLAVLRMAGAREPRL